MSEHQALSRPHRRQNPLTGEWVLVSPHRAKRPWQGAREQLSVEERPSYDPSCYLCPGNERVGGARNEPYESTFVFENDFRALLDSPVTSPVMSPVTSPDPDPLLISEEVSGTCRVICFSPDHSKTIPLMSRAELSEVVALWAEQVEELSARYRWVQIFENKGAAMGCSNPHPHGQIWCTSALPTEAQREDERQKSYLAQHGRPLLLDYVERELALEERVVCQSERWVALVPYWAVWPFETLVLPKSRHIEHLDQLTGAERGDLAGLLIELTTRYDNLFETSFPYSMGWHGAPSDDQSGAWQLHAHFYPPLLRSASVKKFMVGFELLSERQRDLSPEQAAERLRALSTRHYSSAERSL